MFLCSTSACISFSLLAFRPPHPPDWNRSAPRALKLLHFSQMRVRNRENSMGSAVVSIELGSNRSHLLSLGGRCNNSEVVVLVLPSWGWCWYGRGQPVVRQSVVEPCEKAALAEESDMWIYTRKPDEGVAGDAEREREKSRWVGRLEEWAESPLKQEGTRVTGGWEGTPCSRHPSFRSRI